MSILNVSWAPPRTSSAEHPILSYTASAAVAGNVVGSCSSSSPTTSCTMHGVPSGVAVEVTVVAMTDLGVSPPSNPAPAMAN